MSQKFFCDNCGEQVKKDQTRCPHCGRYFRAVKCPECGFSGSPGLFTDGCPACGYAEEGGAENAVLFNNPSPAGRERFFSGKFYRRAILLLSVLLLLLAVLFIRLIWS